MGRLFDRSALSSQVVEGDVTEEDKATKMVHSL